MSEQEYKALYEQYKVDPIIRNTYLEIVRIKTESVPVSFTIDGFLYAKNIE